MPRTRAQSQSKKRKRDTDTTERPPSLKRIARTPPPQEARALGKNRPSRQENAFPKSPSTTRCAPIAGDQPSFGQIRLTRSALRDHNSMQGLRTPSSSVGSRKRRSRSQSKSRKSFSSESTERFSSHHPQYARSLADAGVYPVYMSERPSDWYELQEKLQRPRRSLSPTRFTDDEFERFVMANEKAASEQTVEHDVISKLDGNVVRGESQWNVLFTNMEAFITPTPVAKPQPDRCDGEMLTSVNSAIRHRLSTYLVPGHDVRCPIVPNCFLEAKGPDGKSSVAKAQLCHDLAMGTRAVDQLWHSVSQQDPTETCDYRASSFGATYLDGHLDLYSTHSRRSSSTLSLEYHTTLLGSESLKGSPQNFRRGTTMYRNMIEIARQRRTEAILAANAACERIAAPSTNVNTARAPEDIREGPSIEEAEDETSADELAAPQSTMKHPMQHPRSMKSVPSGKHTYSHDVHS